MYKICKLKADTKYCVSENLQAIAYTKQGIC